MGSCTFTEDTQVHAPGISFLCVCVDVGSDTCLKSPELVHNLGRVFGTVPDVDAYASECCGVGNGGGSGENRQRECWPVGVT